MVWDDGRSVVRALLGSEFQMVERICVLAFWGLNSTIIAMSALFTC